jgi:hypothetical protein
LHAPDGDRAAAGDLIGASAPEREATYYLGLMMNVYCHADAAEQAKWFGDDISFKGAAFDALDMSTAGIIAFLVRRLSSHGGGMARARRLAAFPISGQKQMLVPEHPLDAGFPVRRADRAR